MNNLILLNNRALSLYGTYVSP